MDIRDIPLRDWYADTGRYSHRGHDVVYRRRGAGETLLLIHGFPTASWDFHRLWEALTQRFDVIAPDMIGYGMSAKPRGYPYSLFDQADLMEGLLARLEVSRLNVLSHDYGDTVAQEMLHRAREAKAGGSGYPDIRSAVLLNGGMFYDCIRQAPMQKILRARVGRLVQHLMTRRRFHRSFSAIFGPATRPDAAELDDFWALVTANGGKGVMHDVIQYLGERQRYQDRWTQALAQAPCPLRLIYGPEDPVSGEPIARRFAEAVPQADIVRLDGIGHYPQTEAPERVLEAFFDFHDRLAGEGQ